MTQFVRVGSVDEFEQGVLYDFIVEGKHVVVVRNGERFYAMRNACTHAGYFFSPGAIDGEFILCPAHGAVFRLEDGEPTDGPAGDALELYNVHIDGADVMVAPVR